MLNKFWQWYERHYTLNVGIAAGLFLIQIIHLIWLLGEVVWLRAFGVPLFTLEGVWQTIIIFVDYTEIPAIITTSVVYINELRKRFNYKNFWLLIFINSQWLHLFWITDEFVLNTFGVESQVFTHSHTNLVTPEGTFIWILAWAAILIDYLELPVIYDTLKKLFLSIKQRNVRQFLQEDLRDL